MDRRTILGSSRREPCFLVMLYGALEYDGRVQRLLEVLNSLGDVLVVDVAAQVGADSGLPFLSRRSIWMPHGAGVVRRHLRFWRAALVETLYQRPKAIVGANFFTTFPAWIAATITRRYFIYDAYELIIPGPGEVMSCRDRLWYLMERLAVRRADLIIAANEDRARLMQQHYGLTQKPTVMRNIPPTKPSVVEGSAVLALYPELARRHSNDCLILYQGDVSLSRGIGRFVQSLTHLPENYRMVVVGGGTDLDALRSIGLPFECEGRFTTLGRVENRLLPAITVMADVGIVTYPFQGQNNIYCSPNKVFEYAQAGLPVVATNQLPLRQMVENYHIGELVGENDDAKQVAAVILKVFENKTRYVKALERFLIDHRWMDEAARVRTAVAKIFSD